VANRLSRGDQALTIKEWAVKLGLTYSGLYARLRRMPPDKALAMPREGKRPSLVASGGEELTVREWAARLGMTRGGMTSRFKRMPLAKALAMPKYQRGTSLIAFGGEELSPQSWAAKMGVTRACLLRRLKIWPLEKALTNKKNLARYKMLSHGGRTLSMTEWAKELGVSPSALTHRIGRKGLVDEVFAPRKKATYNPLRRRWVGVKRSPYSWRTFKEFQEDVKPIPPGATMLARINPREPWGKGNFKWICGVKASARSIWYEHDGETLPLSAWAKRNGLTLTILQQRLRKLGWGFERAISTPRYGRVTRVTYRGKTQSIHAWEKERGMTGLLRSRLLKGWPIEKAFEVAPWANKGKGRRRLGVPDMPDETWP